MNRRCANTDPQRDSVFILQSLGTVRAVLLRESPPAFRARNLFVSENALCRA